MAARTLIAFNRGFPHGQAREGRVRQAVRAASFVMLGVLSACGTGGHPPAWSGHHQGSIGGQWHQVSPEGTGLTLAMPEPPTLKVEVEPDFDGTPLRSVVGKVLAEHRAVFGFVVVESPGGFVKDPYALSREAAGDGSDAKGDVIRFDRQYRARGFVVTDRIIDMPHKHAVLYLRVHVGKTRAYGTFLAFSASDEPRLRPVVDRYFDSVQLDPRQALSPAGDGRLALERWEIIYPPEAEFAVRMPGAARGLEREDAIGSQDVRVRQYGVQDAEGKAVFEVVVTRFEEAPPSGAVGSAQSVWTAKGYRVERSGPVHVRGYPGVAVRFRSGTESLHIHYYTTRTRLYEVRVRVPEAQEAALAQARQWFFESFRIL
jgi:hypothetical protein